MLGCKRLKWSTTFWVFVWYPVLVLTNKSQAVLTIMKESLWFSTFYPYCLFAFYVVVVFRFQATNVDIHGAYQQREKFIE